MTIGAVGYSANFESPQQPTALILNLRSSPHHGFIEIFEQLRENEREKKILLASKSGAHIEYIHEKNRDQKISRYCPFKKFFASSHGLLTNLTVGVGTSRLIIFTCCLSKLPDQSEYGFLLTLVSYQLNKLLFMDSYGEGCSSSVLLSKGYRRNLPVLV